jgi:hypothetical protein
MICEYPLRMTNYYIYIQSAPCIVLWEKKLCQDIQQNDTQERHYNNTCNDFAYNANTYNTKYT